MPSYRARESRRVISWRDMVILHDSILLRQSRRAARLFQGLSHSLVVHCLSSIRLLALGDIKLRRYQAIASRRPAGAASSGACWAFSSSDGEQNVLYCGTINESAASAIKRRQRVLPAGTRS